MRIAAARMEVASTATIGPMLQPVAPRFRPFVAAMACIVAALAGCASAPPDTQPTAPMAASASTTAPIPVTPSVAAPLAKDRQVAPTPEHDFAAWVSRFAATARAAGIDEATLHRAFDNIHYLPQVVELDRSQPEFSRTVWDYLDVAVSPLRVARGMDKLLQVRVEADAATARYGVIGRAHV